MEDLLTLLFKLQSKGGRLHLDLQIDQQLREVGVWLRKRMMIGVDDEQLGEREVDGDDVKLE